MKLDTGGAGPPKGGHYGSTEGGHYDQAIRRRFCTWRTE